MYPYDQFNYGNPLMDGGYPGAFGGYPRGGRLPMNPMSHSLATSKEQMNLPLAMMLIQRLQMEQEQQERLQQKAAAFDPAERYKLFGSGMPHMMGLSAQQRFRDMMMRDQARRQEGAEAVAGLKALQATVPAEGSPEQRSASLAASNIQKGVNKNGDVALTGPYGTGHVSKGEKKSFTIDGKKVSGGDLKEFFQRAVNAGSPNAGVGTIPLPEAGYQGIPSNTVAPVNPLATGVNPPPVEELIGMIEPKAEAPSAYQPMYASPFRPSFSGSPQPSRLNAITQPILGAVDTIQKIPDTVGLATNPVLWKDAISRWLLSSR